MKYSFKMPVNVIQEKECVKNNINIFKQAGTKALIVTGRHSAKACGALDDVEFILNEASIDYEIFNEVENNPSLETVVKAADIAKKSNIDFIIGIGGGSPIDASKAIAVLAANDIEISDMFKNKFDKALNIIAVPTTSGTGSEATPYSVLLRKDLQTKVSFGNEYTFPKYALLDPKYTYSLNYDTTVNTAIDAFTHCIEGYLSNRSNSISDALALDAIRIFGEVLKDLSKKNITEDGREKLMYVSLIGGIVIANTGVTIAHGMGYCYTYFKDIPHGKANGLLMKNYLEYVYPERIEKVNKVLELLECRNIKEFADILEIMIGKAPKLTDKEIDQYTKLTLMQQGSMKNTARIVDENIIKMLWEKRNK